MNEGDERAGGLAWLRGSRIMYDACGVQSRKPVLFTNVLAYGARTKCRCSEPTWLEQERLWEERSECEAGWVLLRPAGVYHYAASAPGGGWNHSRDGRVGQYCCLHGRVARRRCEVGRIMLLWRLGR